MREIWKRITTLERRERQASVRLTSLERNRWTPSYGGTLESLADRVYRLENPLPIIEGRTVNDGDQLYNVMNNGYDYSSYRYTYHSCSPWPPYWATERGDKVVPIGILSWTPKTGPVEH